MLGVGSYRDEVKNRIIRKLEYGKQVEDIIWGRFNIYKKDKRIEYTGQLEYIFLLQPQPLLSYTLPKQIQ